MRRTAELAPVEKSGRGNGPKQRKDERGFVLIIVLIIIAALALLGLAANRNMLTDIGIARNHGANTRSFYAAEAAAEYGYNQFSVLLGQGTVPTGQIPYTPPQIQGTPSSATIKAVSYSPTPSAQRTITANTPHLANFKGLTAWVTTYTITATATDTNTNAQSTVMLDAMKYLVPIFQFGIFYNNDLEMNPGANLTIPVNGWIHTNSNLYTSTSATETVNSNITSAGQIDHGRAPNDGTAVGTGTVSIEGANGTYYNLVNGSQTLSNGSYTSNNGWANTVGQWGGNVATGVQSLNLPLPAAASNQSSEYTGPEYILSSSGQGTLASEAAVTITNGTAKDAKGNTLNTCYHNANHKNSQGALITDSGCSGSTNQNSITSGTVYDYRQQATAQTTDIDVNQFQQTPAGTALANAANGGTAGVLYTTSTTANSYNAIRLYDGSTIYSSGAWSSNGTPVGLTVATDLPAYVQGNYNTTNASNGSLPPAAIMSDATTVLSNQWPAPSSTSPYTSTTTLDNRPVTQALTINADIMTGNSPTTQANGYGGGFENFIRFLENWSGENYNFGGSLVCMWQSQKATGKWITTGTYYNAPNRNYTFGVFGANWPPGTPDAIVVTRGSWSHS